MGIHLTYGFPIRITQNESVVITTTTIAEGTGKCSVCGKISPTMAVDGTVHQHGHRDASCTGSDKPPLAAVIGSTDSRPDSQLDARSDKPPT